MRIRPVEPCDTEAVGDVFLAALAGLERPATVISESPDERSSQAIRTILTAAQAH